MSKLKFSAKGFFDFLGKGVFDKIREENQRLELTGYKYKSEKLPKEFDGFRIMQLSDLHNSVYGREADNLIRLAKINKPDIIVITGDSYDSRRRQYFDSLDIIKRLMPIAPIYYITGNHEELSPDIKEIFVEKIKSYGVNFLNWERKKITRGDAAIHINGVPDFSLFATQNGLIQKAINKNLTLDETENMKKAFCDELDNFSENKPDGFNILLSHRPEMHEAYSENKYDLVFCGHAHGGQFIIPPVGAIYSPGQGFLPKYSQGAHEFGDTTMIISRGLGNSSFPVRINNQPEMVIAELHKK